MLITLSPLLALLFCWLYVRQTKVLFSQQRIGKGARPFIIYKIQTILEVSSGYKLTKDAKWLRASGLDELPQLWNIVKGEMAFIGPRPLLPNNMELTKPYNRYRSKIKPGITGLAQVLGRQQLPETRKFAADRYYVSHQTIKLNLWIFWRTLFTLGRE